MTAFLSPCGGGNGSLSPLVSPEEVLALIGEHLGAESEHPSTSSTKVDEEERCEPAKNASGQPSSSSSSNACRNLCFSCPALSLTHKEHLDMDHSSRRQAERYALSLLSRPLLVGEKEDDEELSSSSTTTEVSEIAGFPCKGLPEAPAVLLRNIYESFAMLVDSRLRAYATFMARHCDTLARSKKNGVNSSTAAVGVRNVEQKLVTLLGVGSRIEASSMRTTFEVTETATTDEEEDDEDLKHKSYSLPLRLEAVINLIVPGPSGEVDTLSVAQTTTGIISGLFTPGSSKPREVHVTLDTKELLSSMMLQAARVVALVVDLTNRAYGVGPEEPKLPRGDSYLVMPPPMPQNPSLQNEQQQLGSSNSGGINKRTLEGAHASWVGISPSELPIVSPDLFALNSPYKPMPHLFLDYQQDGFFDPVDYLSPDQCADVVDGIFGVLDDSVFMAPPANKKLKSDCT